MSRYHRRHHRKGMGAFLDPVLGEVKGQDVLLGGIVGLAGSGLVQWAFNKITFTVKDDQGNAKRDSAGAEMKVGLLDKDGPLGKAAILAPAITSSLAGVALYMVQKKTAPTRGKGHLVGAVSAGLGISAWNYLQQMYPANFPVAPEFKGYSNYVTLPSMRDYVEKNLGLGIIGQNPAMPFSGVIGSNPIPSYNGVIASNPRLAEVTASAMMGGMGEYDMMDVFSE
jgi:hypothetical protein